MELSTINTSWGLNTKTVFAIVFFSFFVAFCVSSEDYSKDDENLLAMYIQSKGESNVVFSPENVKLFWTDKTVSKGNNRIAILLTPRKDVFQSSPLKVQFKNVNELQDCRIEVITDENDIHFSVNSSKSKKLAESASADDFLRSHIYYATIHLEDTENYVFYLVFSSQRKSVISIKSVIFSFENNIDTSFCVSPGNIEVLTESASNDKTKKKEDSSTAFELTKTKTSLSSKKKILVSDHPVVSNVTIKNVGTNSARINLGYAVYSKDHKKLSAKNYPYNGNNTLLQVVSAQKGSDAITVNQYPAWRKNCFIALDAREDMTDVPNYSILDARVDSVKKLQDGQAEIKLNSPLKSDLPPRTSIRIHGNNSSNLTISTIDVLPGEEKTVSSEIKRDNSVDFSTKALGADAYYIIPFISLGSNNLSDESAVLIKSFTVSY